MARRHGELFIDPRLERFFFTFTWLKNQGFVGSVALRISELIFGVLVFTLSTIILSALLRWRSRARHRRLAR
jgi:hypothetical protein